MAKKSKQTTSIDSYTQGLQRDNYQNAMQKFGNAEYRPVSSEDISGFMSPYQQQVIDSSLATLGDQESMALNAQRDAAIRAKAFGGTGRDVAEALTRGEYAKTRASTVAGLNNQNYSQALQTAVGQNSASNQYPLLIQQLLNGTLGGVTPTTTSVSKTTDPMAALSALMKAAGAISTGGASLAAG
jgi:hypothetical protein